MLDSLAPRRKRLILIVVVAALTGLVAVLVVVLRPAARHPPVNQSSLGPVLLVPGYGGSTSAFDDLAKRLRTTRDVTVVALPDQAMGDLDQQARTLGSAVGKALDHTHASSVDLVGYSDGGIVVRLYIRFHGGGGQVRRVVTFGAPNHGTMLALNASAAVPGACVDACEQVLPGSALLTKLNAGGETPRGIPWVSIYTEQDDVVTPAITARLRGAVNVDLQSVCADEKVNHGGLPHSHLVIGLVVQALGTQALVAPTPSACHSLRQLGS